MQTDMSFKTAIKRSKLSRPMHFLNSIGMLGNNGIVLDYGCGRGDDADKFWHVDKYDKHYFPEIDLTKRYNVITCNYVLNTIPDESDRQCVVDRIKSLLAEDGIAYITVRRDVKQDGYTKTGTWQGNVTVPNGVLIKQTAGFAMYKVYKQ